MTSGLSVLHGAVAVAGVFGMLIGTVGKPAQQPLVRIAELEIDASQISAYKDALKEEIATLIR